MGWKQWLTASVLASGLAVGTGLVAPHTASAQKKDEQAPQVLTPTDISLAASVRATLVADNSLGLANINVSAKDGRVMLAGTVESDNERDMAVAKAKTVPGVTEVDEDLRVIHRTY